MGQRILGTGYNGSLPGLPHCDEVGHDLVMLADGSENCVRTVHAEQNSIAHAARHGVALDMAHLYTNTFPCWACFRAIASAGIIAVIYDAPYRQDPRVEAAAKAMGINLINFKELE